MPKYIPIERLDTGTLIYIETWAWGTMTAPFHDFATVEEIEFDGYGYALTLGDGDRHYVDAGESVRFGGIGEPVLRRIEDVSSDELEAKIEADNAAIDANIAEANARCADLRGEYSVAAE